MKKRYEAKISEIIKVSTDIEAFGEEFELSMPTIFALNLCVDELFTNIVDYGYKNAADKFVDIDLEIKEGNVVLKIADDAPEFNPLKDAKEPDLNASLEDRQIGGLGVFFVKKNMDEVFYERKNNRNELTLIKKLSC